MSPAGTQPSQPDLPGTVRAQTRGEAWWKVPGIALMVAVAMGAWTWVVIALTLPESGFSSSSFHQAVASAGVALGVGITAVVCLNRSKAQREKMLRELETAESMLMSAQKLEAFGVLAASMAHDFNNTLTVIRGMSELAKLEAYEPRVSKSALDAIHMSTYRAEEIAQRMVELLGQPRDRFALRDLNAVTREFSPILRQAAGPQAIMAYDLEDSLPATQMNRGVIEQALLNLVINARDAVENIELPRITVSTRRVELIDQCSVVCPDPVSGTFVEVAVSDNGCGIAEREIPRAFTPFFTTKKNGTGLGLPSVLRAVQQHDGIVDVESRLGAGTCVRLLIPLRNSLRKDGSESVSPASPSAV